MAEVDEASGAAEPAGAPPDEGSRWGLALALLVLGLLAFFLAPYVVRDYRFAVGADAPVYLWWARLARHDGLSAVGSRPGVPALILVLRGTLGLSPVVAVAATGAVLAAAVGPAAAAVVAGGRRAVPRAAWIVAGLFVGLYASSLANGYLSSLAAAVVFLGAIAALVARRPAAAVAGAVLLGAAGVAHPAFFGLSVAVLALTFGWIAVRTPPPRLRNALARGTDGRRMAGAVGGGVGVAVAGAAATAAFGPGPIRGADTSKDAFLRRAGLTAELHDLYRSRFASNWLRTLLPVHVPLAAYGAGRARTTADDPLRRRILLSWLALTAAGMVAAVATGLLPAERFVSFAFALPILSAAGALRLWRRGGWGRPVAGLAIAAVVVGSALAWWHPAESIRAPDMAEGERAAQIVASIPEGTPVVVVVDDPEHAAIGVPRLANELRGALPPDRLRDVHLFVGRPQDYLAGRPTSTGDRLRDAMSEVYLSDLRTALAGAERPAVALVLRSMNEPGYPAAVRAGREVAPGVAVIGPAPAIPPQEELPAAPDPARPSSPWCVVLASLAALALVSLAGAGWARAVLGPGVAHAAAAPAFGIGALMLAGTLVDRLGIRLTGAVPVVISLAVVAGGILVSQRRDVQREDGLE